jgi:hypothetical protein
MCRRPARERSVTVVHDSRPPGGTTRLPLHALLAANAISLLGNVVAAVAIPWLVLEETGSAALTGLAAALAALPLAVGALFGGAVVDRLGARRASVIADVASGAAVAAIPLLDAAGRLSFLGIATAALLGAVGGRGVVRGLRAPRCRGRTAVRPVVEPGKRYLRDLVEGLRFVRRDAVVLALLVQATLRQPADQPARARLPARLRARGARRAGRAGPHDRGVRRRRDRGNGPLRTARLARRAGRPVHRREDRLRRDLAGADRAAAARRAPTAPARDRPRRRHGQSADGHGAAGAGAARAARRVLATTAASVALAVPVGTLLGGLAIEWLGLRGAFVVLALGNLALSVAAVGLLMRRTLSLERAAAAP